MEESVKRSILQEYALGDMTAIYYLAEETRQPELLLIPSVRRNTLREMKFSRGNSMLQVKIAGDAYPGAYAGGLTMQNGGTVLGFQFERQEKEELADRTVIHTVCRDRRNYELTHHLTWYRGEASVTSYVTFENLGNETAMLEMLASFCLNEITPFTKGDAANKLKLHRIRSKWSAEGRLTTESLEDLQLEPSWSRWQPHAERFGQAGSMPVKKFFPFAALEDTKAGIVWGATLAAESSWQMEVYRRDDAVSLCGGLADREFGHWMKAVAPGESFQTPYAILSVCAGGVDYLSQRLTSFARRFVNAGPECEQHLPILFNEYCTTWGLPSHDNISRILKALKGRPVEYFVIDCGWFVEKGKRWDISMGDYRPSKELFPEGLAKTTEMIRDAGMKPGLWFEIDNVGEASAAYQEEEHLLKRDGYVLTTASRRFFDMRSPWVQNYLTEKVIGQLKQYGFSYMKMDYNDTIGIGCDGAESLGEALRQNMEASVNFVRKVKEEIPDIILENCASGGHKLEPLMMSLCSMASFSDAHECEEIPLIAANLHRAILPRQSQIWAVIREDASPKRISYLLAATFLGRMCLSGDVTRLSKKQWKLIDQAMEFYRLIAPCIKDGYTYFYGEKKASDRRLKGWQGILRVRTDPCSPDTEKTIYGGPHPDAYLTFHTFHGKFPKLLSIPLPEGCPERIVKTYSDRPVKAYVKNHILYYKAEEDMQGSGIYLAK